MSVAVDDHRSGPRSVAKKPSGVGNQKRRKMRLGEMLVQAGYITDDEVGRALAVQKMGGGRLGSILVKLKFCTDDHIREVLADQLSVQVVELTDFTPEPEVLELVPTDLIRKYELVPIRKDGDNLWVAMMDPYNLTAIDDLKFATGCRHLTIVTCTEDDFKEFLEENLQTQCLIEEILEGGDFYDKAINSLDEDMRIVQEESEEDLVHDLKLAGEQPPIVTLCNFLLVESINRGASDIHIEPYETYFRIRFRVDGRLMSMLTPPHRLHRPMIARMKILAEMDISKSRIPQDGHIAIQYKGETVHYRVSTLPTVYGEKCVIRLLKKDNGLMDLNKLGFTEAEFAILRANINKPQGIVLVTGPTGSGKTTTLHAALAYINDPEVNIVTLEDPVEASIDGINHVQVATRGGGDLRLRS